MVNTRFGMSIPLALALLGTLTGTMLGGCSTYTAPGKPADFRALGITPDHVQAISDPGIDAKMSKRPTAGFPTTFAVVRVQDAGYKSHRGEAYGDGRFTAILGRDEAPEEAMKKLQRLPMLRGIAALNRLVLSDRVQGMNDLRGAAASVQADVLLVYTLDTQFRNKSQAPVLGLITLGMASTELAKVTSTASAALIDTRTGYIYGLAEATAKNERTSNGWDSAENLDQVRIETEQKAVADLADELVSAWTQVVAMYGPPTNAQGAPASIK